MQSTMQITVYYLFFASGLAVLSVVWYDEPNCVTIKRSVWLYAYKGNVVYCCGLDGTCALYLIEIVFVLPILSMVTVLSYMLVLKRGPKLQGTNSLSAPEARRKSRASRWPLVVKDPRTKCVRLELHFCLCVDQNWTYIVAATFLSERWLYWIMPECELCVWCAVVGKTYRHRYPSVRLCVCERALMQVGAS